MANVQVQKNQPQQSEGQLARREAGGVLDPFRMMRRLLSWDPFREMMPITTGAPVLDVAFDVKETDDGYTFTADVPGIDQKDIDINLTGNRLSITGKRETQKEEKNERYYSCERSYGSFTRSFTLPENADLEHVNADMKDGVLTIAVHKKDGGQQKPKKVEIGKRS